MVASQLRAKESNFSFHFEAAMTDATALLIVRVFLWIAFLVSWNGIKLFAEDNWWYLKGHCPPWQWDIYWGLVAVVISVIIFLWSP